MENLLFASKKTAAHFDSPLRITNTACAHKCSHKISLTASERSAVAMIRTISRMHRNNAIMAKTHFPDENRIFVRESFLVTAEEAVKVA